MTDSLKELLEDYMELIEDPDMSCNEALKLLKIDAINGLSKSIRDCFESSDRLPSVPEAIVMAGNSITRKGLDIRITKED